MINNGIALMVDIANIFIGESHMMLFSCVLRDSIPRFVRPLVGRSVGWLVGRSPFYFFYVFAVFGLTASCQML